MTDTIAERINRYRQKIEGKIRSLAAPVFADPAPEKPKYPEDATQVLTHFGSTYMRVWLDNSATPPQTCFLLRNGVTVRLDQRITQALAIALLKLPYITAAPEAAPAQKEETNEREDQVRGQEPVGQD
jgi:hypothetical protein